MYFFKNKLSVFLLLAAFLVQTGAVFLFFPGLAKSQDDSTWPDNTNTAGETHSKTTDDGTSTTVYENEDPENIEIFIEHPMENSRISETVNLVARTSHEVEVLYFELVGEETRHFLANHEHDNVYLYEFNSREATNGSYYLIAEAHWEGREKRAIQRVVIENEVEPENYTEEDEQASSTQDYDDEHEEQENEEEEYSEDQTNTNNSSENTNEEDASHATDESEQVNESPLLNENEHQDSTSSAEILWENNPASSTSNTNLEEEDYRIKIDETPDIVHGPITIKARVNFVPDEIEFMVVGEEVRNVPARQIGPHLFTLAFSIDNHTKNQEYSISAVALKEGEEYSDTIKIKYEKEALEQSEDEIPELELEFMNPPSSVSGNAKIIVSANRSLDKVDFSVNGKISQKFSGQSELENTYHFIWPSLEFPDGVYEVSAGAIEFGVLQKSIVITIQVKNNFQEQENINTTDLSANTEDQNLAGELGLLEEEISPECKIKNIFNKDACDEFLALPVTCRLQGIKNKNSCQEYMGLDPVCREKKYSLAKCEKFLKLPAVCQEAEEFEGDSCKELVRQNSLPEDCRQAGIGAHVECEKYLLKKQMPAECQELGIESIEECNIETREAVTETEIKVTDIPQICLDNKIVNQGQCDSFIKERKQEKECELLEIGSDKECNDFLFDKYALDFCSYSGINSKEECRSFLFNHYKDILRCQKGDEWFCQNDFRENYLGRIIEKQTKFEAIRKELGREEAVETKVLRGRLGENNIIPFRDDNVVVRIKRAEEEILVNEDKEIIQTSPAVLIIDSDQDGLPDSTEERIGTDPFSKDSDGDGYDDNSEIENGYNPLGDGKVAENILSSIDQAILNNQKIKHPKTSGEVSEEYKVQKVETIENALEEVEAYLLSGTAEPNQVLTLYVYSDLPVVTTVQTDASGNWQYEFRNVLSEGDHEVYVVVNDNTGKVLKKSSPLNFFVKEARAVSVNDYFAAVSISNTSEAKTMINYYLVVAIALIASSIALFVFYIVYYRKKQTV